MTQPLARAAGEDHLAGMTSQNMGRRPAAGGPIIDQDGREVRSETLRDASFGRSAPQFEFHTFGFNAQPLTREQRFARLEALGQLLDMAFIVPGTNFRYGIDGLIGLIPVVGDIVTTAIALWVVREARALGAPRYLVARMLANVAIDGAVGIVPVIGDAFDVAFKANVRNVRMLRKWMDKQK
jgi:Domain of unknown function (DUF4112)